MLGGGILQTLIGLLIYGTLRNGLDNIPSIDIYLKEFITGVVLIAALIANVIFCREIGSRPHAGLSATTERYSGRIWSLFMYR